MNDKIEHFALQYAQRANEILHRLSPRWHYEYQIYEVPGIITALFITPTDRRNDEFEVFTNVASSEFAERMDGVMPGWGQFVLEDPPNMRAGQGNQQTFYIIKAGNSPSYWTPENAQEIVTMLSEWNHLMPDFMLYKATHVREIIPPGTEQWAKYEDYVAGVVSFLFAGLLDNFVLQKRTETQYDSADRGVEIRDLLCQNRADSGFWGELKGKYECSEVLFEAKNKETLDRDDLRQTYCYLKPSIGFWGFIVCRSEQPDKIVAYNRTLFSNFVQRRGVMILTDEDLSQMVELKLQEHDPASFLWDLYSEFIRSV